MGRIMVVDDEPDMRLAVRLLLERHGHTVEEAASGEDACQRVQGAPPDLLLMDIRMPGQDGLESLEKIRESNTTMPVIIMTGYGNPDTEREAFRKGANDFILKPFRNEDLLEAIAHVGLTEGPIKAVPIPEKRRMKQSNILQHYIPPLRRFWYLFRQAKAIFLDRWHNPPILFERDPSFEDRISLRLSLITDPIKVIYQGLFDPDYEFPTDDPVEGDPPIPVEPFSAVREPVYPKTVRPAPQAHPTSPPMAQPAIPERDVDRVQKDLTQQIQSVAQTLQAEIGRLAQQMQQRQDPPKAAPEEAPAPQGLRESPQEEYHRLLIELQTDWDHRLSALGKELISNKDAIAEWSKTLPDLRKAVDRSKAA